MTADNLPAPLVPAEVDLRGHDWMPLYGERLFGSETWIESSNEARVAALRLWWQAFAKEKPAASLPDSDRLLAVYAGYGEVVKAWKKVKAEAMRGFVLCSDGRWYHKVVAEVAMESWQRQQDHQETNSAKTERQKRWRERLKALASALRAAGQTPPRGASLETLEKMARDAGVDVPTASAEIGNTGQDKTENDKTGKVEGAGAPRPVPAAELDLGQTERQPGIVNPDDDDLAPPLDLDRSDEARPVVAWNAAADAVNAELGHTEWPRVLKLNPKRKATVKRLLKTHTHADIECALRRAMADPWARGQTKRSAEHVDWHFNFDHFAKEQTVTRYLEKPDGERPRSHDHAERSVIAGVAALAEAGSR